MVDKWRGPDFSITSFEVNEPVKQDGFWDVVTVAVVAYRKREVPRDPKKVVFDAEGKTLAVVETDEQGRASYVYSFDSPGSWLIAAQIDGVPGSRHFRRVPIKEDKPKQKIPGELVVKKIGFRGNYTFYISVLETGTKVPIPGAKIKIYSPGSTKFPLEKNTGKTGIFRWKLEFTNKERLIRISVPEAEKLEWKMWLNGPKPIPSDVAEKLRERGV